MLDNAIMAHYGKIEYWEERYLKRNDQFDWYQTYPDLKEILSNHISKNAKILNVGCGNSRLSESMYEDGYENIINIDFSNKVIQYMDEKCRGKYPKMIFKVLDACEMKDFDSGQFNIVLDKGTLDSILCSENPLQNSQKMISEVYRVLNHDGKYICISFGDSEHRMKFFKSQNWIKINYEKIIKPFAKSDNNLNEGLDFNNYHFIYIMTKA